MYLNLFVLPSCRLVYLYCTPDLCDLFCWDCSLHILGLFLLQCFLHFISSFLPFSCLSFLVFSANTLLLFVFIRTYEGICSTGLYQEFWFSHVFICCTHNWSFDLMFPAELRCAEVIRRGWLGPTGSIWTWLWNSERTCSSVLFLTASPKKCYFCWFMAVLGWDTFFFSSVRGYELFCCKNFWCSSVCVLRPLSRSLSPLRLAFDYQSNFSANTVFTPSIQFTVALSPW